MRRCAIFVAVLTVLATLRLTAAARYYCDPNLCRQSSPHIACNNEGAFGKNCSANAQLIPIQWTLQSLIVDRHNKYRNQVARGALRKFQPANRMATMLWGRELAYLAELNVKQCLMEHDKCRNTNKFKYVGQNLAYSAWSGPRRTVESEVMAHIRLWYSELREAKMQQLMSIDYSVNSPNGTTITHFTQLLQEKATHVGCGILRQTKGNFTYQFFACNYAYGNVLNRPVYTSGGAAASQCRTGVNQAYPYLCSTREVYPIYSIGTAKGVLLG